MARTGAERVRDHRQRQVDLIASLRSQVASLESRLADSEAERGRLGRTVATLDAALEAQVAGERRSGCPGGRHPSEAVDNGQCTACGDWL